METENRKALALRLLDAAKEKCAQAVLGGDMTADEYAVATGESAEGILERVVQSVAKEYAMEFKRGGDISVAAAVNAYQVLTGAGADEDTIRKVLGDTQFAQTPDGVPIIVGATVGPMAMAAYGYTAEEVEQFLAAEQTGDQATRMKIFMTSVKRALADGRTPAGLIRARLTKNEAGDPVLTAVEPEGGGSE